MICSYDRDLHRAWLQIIHVGLDDDDDDGGGGRAASAGTLTPGGNVPKEQQQQQQQRQKGAEPLTPLAPRPPPALPAPGAKASFNLEHGTQIVMTKLKDKVLAELRDPEKLKRLRGEVRQGIQVPLNSSSSASLPSHSITSPPHPSTPSLCLQIAQAYYTFIQGIPGFVRKAVPMVSVDGCGLSSRSLVCQEAPMMPWSPGHCARSSVSFVSVYSMLLAMPRNLKSLGFRGDSCIATHTVGIRPDSVTHLAAAAIHRPCRSPRGAQGISRPAGDSQSVYSTGSLTGEASKYSVTLPGAPMKKPTKFHSNCHNHQHP